MDFGNIRIKVLDYWAYFSNFASLVQHLIFYPSSGFLMLKNIDYKLDFCSLDCNLDSEFFVPSFRESKKLSGRDVSGFRSRRLQAKRSWETLSTRT